MIPSITSQPRTNDSNQIHPCTFQTGSSRFDRNGCVDSDGDGYSDPSSTWTITKGADWRSNDATQWRDSDEDGYGDNWGDSSWNSSRMSNWPGEFIPGATKPDRCPSEPYGYAQSNGCPPGAEGTGNEQNQNETTSSGGGNAVMYAVVGVAVALVLGLVAAVTMLLRTQQPKARGRVRLHPEESGESGEAAEEGSMDIDSEQQNRVQTWEELPPGGEYLPQDSDGILWYETLEGEHWRQEEDQSWILWKD